MLKITVSGTVDKEPEDILKFINGEDVPELGTYKNRFVEGHIFIYEIFCELGYGQNANGNGRTGYLALYDFLKDFDNKKETEYKKQVKLFINKTGCKEVMHFGKVLETSNGEYPSQEWHYLISYTAWNRAFGKKCGKNFKCAELLLYLYELIDDKKSIERIINAFITGKDEKEKFISHYNLTQKHSYNFQMDNNINIFIAN